MGTTINSYSVGFGMDASGYIDGARLSRSETRQLIKAIEDARTPAEKFYLEYDKLEKAFQSGAISLDVYSRLLAKQREILEGATKNTAELAEAERKLNAETREGEQVTKSLMTAQEKHAAEVRRLDGLVKTQSIGQETYRRALEQSTNSLRQSDPEFQKQQANLQKGQALLVSMQTPQEKYAAKSFELNELHKSGAISAETYRRAMASIAPDLPISALDKYSGAIAGVSFAAYAAIAGGGAAFVTHIRATQGAIDDAVDSAGKLGIGFNELKALRFAAQEGGGVDAGTTDAAIKKMLIATQKAIDGDQTTRDAFNRLGLDAGELIKKGPVASVLAIADAMKGVDSQGEKLALTMDIFGKSGTELVSTLDQGADSISEAIDFQQQWNSLTDAQLLAVGQNNDAWDRINVAIEGVSTKLAAEAAPAMLLIADYLLGSADKASSLDGFMRGVVGTSTFLVGQFNDVLDAATGIWTVLYKTATMDFTGAAESLKEAVTFDKTTGALNALAEKRKELEAAASSAEDERDKKRQQMIASEIQMKETAEEKAEKQRQERERAAEQRREDAEKKREAKEKQRERETEEKRIRKEKEDILKNAEAEVKKRMGDVAKGPGGGMEVGSADAAKFFADQRNNAIAASMNQGEQTVLAEAVKQTLLLQEQKAKTEKQIGLLDGILEQQKKNGFKRLR